MKAPEPERWSLKGLLTHFQNVHENMPDHAFAWIVGAGASLQSGIPAGAQLVDWWLRELHILECRDDTPFEPWATEEKLGIDRFDLKNAASFYPRVYERRFRDFPDQGYAYLETVMSGKTKEWKDGRLAEMAKPIEPSPGYSILAKIMEKTRHRAVVTTNFDNLVADSLHIYADVFPLVCGHELLASYVRVAMRRPLICKIHRDLLFSPLNESRGLRRLHESWATALRSLFSHYTPIVIGYGGNDESLMGLLESFGPEEIRRRFIWCFYEGKNRDSEPRDAIKRLVCQHNGVLVPVPDFDRFMILLGARIEIQPLDHVLGERAKKRTQSYQRAILEMSVDDYPEILDAIGKVYTRAGVGWWPTQLRVNAETDPEKREAKYRSAIQELPTSAELTGNFAVFMQDIRKNHNEAERLYKKAIELDPKDADYVGNFALFMKNVRKNYDEAERLFQKAVELDPNHANVTGNFAVFKHQVRKHNDEAERLFQKALELDPNHANITGNFAAFLNDERRNYDEAERLFNKALQLDPNDANITGRFARFMADVRKKYDEAEQLFKRALGLNPNNVNITGNFALFMQNVRRNHDEAERLFKKALELDPHDANITGNFAAFQHEVRGNHDEAERLFRKALELDPNDANHTSNFAAFMQNVRKNYNEAERFFKKALELNPADANQAGNLAGLVLAKGDVDEARRLLDKARDLNADNKNQLRAELLLYSAVAQAVSGENPERTFLELRTVLDERFERDGWCFDFLWDAYKTKLDPKDLERLMSFGDAITDEEKAKSLAETLNRIDSAGDRSTSPGRKPAGRKKNAIPEVT
jgi:Tfp pilus assembly protein PilF